MFDNFVTLEYILSFPGMIAIVMLLSQFTKRLFDKICNNKTKYIVYTYAFLLCLLGALYLGKFGDLKESLQTITEWGINSVIIWFASMKAYETIPNK